jgi:hypothetical protein
MKIKRFYRFSQQVAKNEENKKEIWLVVGCKKKSKIASEITPKLRVNTSLYLEVDFILYTCGAST